MFRMVLISITNTVKQKDFSVIIFYVNDYSLYSTITEALLDSKIYYTYTVCLCTAEHVHLIQNELNFNLWKTVWITKLYLFFNQSFSFLHTNIVLLYTLFDSSRSILSFIQYISSTFLLRIPLHTFIRSSGFSHIP